MDRCGGSDAYGGNLENRVRFLRELIEDTRDAVGDTCAVALRIAMDELRGPDGLQSDGEILRANPMVNVVLEGHCDERGTAEFLRSLGGSHLERLEV